MSTPNVAALADRESQMLLPILSPGFHSILFSADALKAEFLKAGFGYAAVQEDQHSLLVVATVDGTMIEADLEYPHKAFADYTTKRMTTIGDDNSLWSGYAYRNFKTLINLGSYAEAEAALARATALGGTETLAADVAAVALPAAAPRRTVRGLPGPVAALALAPDGSAVIAGSGGEVRAWDTASGQLLRTLAVEGAPVRALLALPGGRSLVVAAEGAPLALWDLGSGKAVRSFERTVGFATCLALAPDGPLVVAGGSDRTVRVFDAATGRWKSWPTSRCCANAATAPKSSSRRRACRPSTSKTSSSCSTRGRSA